MLKPVKCNRAQGKLIAHELKFKIAYYCSDGVVLSLKADALETVDEKLARFKKKVNNGRKHRHARDTEIDGSEG